MTEAQYQQLKNRAQQLIQQQGGIQYSGANPETAAILQKYKSTEQTTSENVVPQENTEDMSIGGFLGNIIPSGVRAVKDIYSAIKSPIKTATAIGTTIEGGVEKLIPGEQGYEKQFDQVVEFFKERYGSIDAAKVTAYEDPVGFLLDASAVLTGGAGLTKSAASTTARVAGETSRVGRVASTVGGAAEKIGQAGRAIDPIVQATRGALGTTTKVSKYATELLTGVEPSVLSRYYNTVRNAPERASNALEIITRTPDAPMRGLVTELADAITSLKERARTTYEAAKEATISSNAGKTFNVGARVQEIGKVLRNFNLKVKNGIVEATTRTSPFSSRELSQIQSVVDRLKLKDLSVNELLDLDASVRRFFDEAIKADNKALVAMGYELTNKTSKMIDDLLPSLKEANDLYRKYYKVQDDLGYKIVDASGNVKNGAESFVSNSINQNKGIIRDKLRNAAKSLGVNVLEDVELIRDMQKLMKQVPNTTRNRTTDMLRGITGGAGLVTGNFALPIILYIFSSPQTYKTVIDVIAGSLSKLPIDEAISRIPQEELSALLQVIEKVGFQAGRLNEQTDATR